MSSTIISSPVQLDVAGRTVWAEGNLALISSLPTALAITGTCSSTSYGKVAGYSVTFWAAEEGLRVVTGLNDGVDRTVVRSAMVFDLHPIVITARSVTNSHAHSGLQAEIVRRGGLVLSTSREQDQVLTYSHMKDARQWMGTVTSASVIVEASSDAAALETARGAQAARKPIGAVPGPITVGSSQGCHELLAQGAVPITGSAAVRELIHQAR